MNKKYQVFISSTFTDLQVEREAVLEALLQLNCIPSGMELFPASSEDQWTLIKRVIDDSDYYIVIVAGRYGSTAPDGISYTEKEYDYAVNSGKFVLGFLHKDPSALSLKNSETDRTIIDKLERFRAKVKTRMCRFWTSADELRGMVSTSLAQQIFLYPSEGWIRGRYAKTTEELEKVNAMHEQIRLLEREVERLRSLSPAHTEHLAQGDDVIPLSFLINGQRRSIQATWNALFKVVGNACLELEKEVSICLSLSEWIAKQLGETNTIIDTSEIWRMARVQFVCLGLIEPEITIQSKEWSMDRLAPRPLEAVRRWRLTDQGRALLGALSAVLRTTAEAAG